MPSKALSIAAMTWFSSMFGRRITEADLAAAVTSATTSSLLNAHIAECNRFKQEIQQELRAQAEERKEMHGENSAKFDKINRSISYAAGAMAVLVFLVGMISAFAQKLIH